MIISHKYRFIFIANGKTGTRSVHKMLGSLQEEQGLCYGQEGLWVGGHLPAVEVRKRIGEEVWNDYFKFSFVRNPWDWVVSQWFYNMIPDPTWLLSRDVMFTARRALRTYKSIKYFRWQKFSTRDIRLLFDALQPYRGIRTCEGYFQTAQLEDESGNTIVDKIFRFEMFEREMNTILKVLGIPSINYTVPHANSTRHRNWRTYYSKASADEVYRLWERDIKKLGYDHPYA